MRKSYLLSILFCLIPLSGYAFDNSGFHFRKIQVDQGLSENSIFSILQDSKGFMWFGTKDGLNRYDGNRFKVFRNVSDDSLSLGNNFIRCMVENKSGNFYVGTDGGLYIMNSQEETFSAVNFRYAELDNLTNAVNALLIDQEGIVWVGTMNRGVFRYDPVTKELSEVNIYNYTLGGNAVWTIHQDKAGVIWIGTRLGLLKYDPSIDLLVAIDTLFDNEHTYKYEVLSIMEDSKGNFWLGTWAGGLIFYNKHTDKHTAFLDQKSNLYYVSHIRVLYEYEEDQIMIGSDDGLYLFSAIEGRCVRVDTPNLPHSLSDQNVYSLYKDREGGIWIGTYFGGINYLNTSLTTIEYYYPDGSPHQLSGKAVSQFLEDEKGNLWIATEDGGVNYFDIRTRKISQPISTSYHNTHALLLDGEELWIGTFSRGIDVYNTRTGKVHNYRFERGNLNTLTDDCVFSLYRTKADEIYVGTPEGACRFNREKGTFERLPQVTGFVYDMKEDDYGNLWIASYGNGVIKYNTVRNEWTHYDYLLPKNHPIVQSKLTGIHIDSRNRLWFSSEGRGIFQYIYKEDHFTQLSEANGLLNNVVYGILDDQLGNLWISCNKGLVCFHPDEPENYLLYTRNDGLQSNQFNYKSVYRARDGKFYFGGINGFNCFYPQQLLKSNNDFVPPVEITALTLLNGSPVLDKQIQATVNKGETVKLPHNRSSFSLSFIGLSYVSPEKNRYAYQLVGADQKWIYSDNSHSVNYVNLPPGKYTFKVKASNNNGVWNETGKKLSIEILPPAWLTLQAKVIYLLLAFLIAYCSFVYYMKRYKTKQEHQLEVFKQEQEALAFKSKIEFFTTIAHEIRTPVSLIKAPLEEVINSNLKPEEVTQNLNVIEKNCDRLSVLINQLLDFRKMDTDSHTIRPEQINLSIHITELYERFKKTAQKSKINFELVSTLEAEDQEVIFDPDALTKIVGNLLMNALKYTQDKITLRLHSLSGKSYRIEVEDNGPGIPDEKKGMIFDPFFQLDNSKDKVGTGIGLSLVRYLAEILQAQIRIEDSRNGGSVFILEFSSLEHLAHQVVKRSEGQQVIERIVQEEGVPTDKNEAILVVDDNHDITGFLKSSLQTLYKVDVAHDGAEALGLLEQRSYDLIISDILMPGIDGIAFTRTVKGDTNYSHIPVILLSAKTENNYKVDGLQSGADVYMEKPFSIAFLKAQIRSLLDNRKALHEMFNRSPLASYTMLATNKYDEEFLDKLNTEIEEHLSDIYFSIESLTDYLGMSRSNLQRKIKSICGVTPNDYLKTYRLKKACLLLLENRFRINEVAYEVGFNSPSYFTKCFLKQYGVLPKEFIKNSQAGIKEENATVG